MPIAQLQKTGGLYTNPEAHNCDFLENIYNDIGSISEIYGYYFLK
jgi:hypothetical protein